MKSYKLSELTTSEVDSLKARPRIDFSSIFGTVQPIVDDVRNRVTHRGLTKLYWIR